MVSQRNDELRRRPILTRHVWDGSGRVLVLAPNRYQALIAGIRTLHVPVVRAEPENSDAPHNATSEVALAYEENRRAGKNLVRRDRTDCPWGILRRPSFRNASLYRRVMQLTVLRKEDKNEQR